MSRTLRGVSTTVAVAAMTGALAFGATPAIATSATSAPAAVHVDNVKQDEPIEMVITKDNYQQVMDISKKRPVILFFHFEGCGGCEELDPVITRFAHDDAGKWMLGRLDTDDNPELADQWNIDGCPTLLAVKDGKEVLRKLAYNGEPESIREWVDKALSKAG